MTEDQIFAALMEASTLPLDPGDDELEPGWAMRLIFGLPL